MTKSLTAAAVEKLKPAKHRLEFPDGLLPGMYLVVQPTGAKSWAVRYRCAGKSRKLTLGSYPALELADAREEARAALQRVQKGGDPGREKKIARRRAAETDDSFDAISRLFIERYQKPKNRSWRETARLLGLAPAEGGPTDNVKTFVVLKGSPVSKWGHRKISDIRKSDVIAFLDDVVDRGAPIVANRLLSAVRKLFNWTVERDLIATSPCAGVKPPGTEQSRDRVLTDDEVKAVWTAADDTGWPFGLITQLLILTAQRREEVGQMRWSEIDLDRKLWTLPRGRVKNDHGHEVPLSDAAIAILEKIPHVKDCDFLFSTTGRNAVSGYSKAKDAIDEKSGVADWRLHDLRRSVASGMARLGIALPVIEKVLNHTSGSFRGIVGVYQRHHFADEKRAALETWARFLMSLIEGQPAANVVTLHQVGEARV